MDETQKWIDRNLLPDEEEGSGIYDEFGNELSIGENETILQIISDYKIR